MSRGRGRVKNSLIKGRKQNSRHQTPSPFFTPYFQILLRPLPIPSTAPPYPTPSLPLSPLIAMNDPSKKRGRRLNDELPPSVSPESPLSRLVPSERILTAFDTIHSGPEMYRERSELGEQHTQRTSKVGTSGWRMSARRCVRGLDLPRGST